MPTPFESIISSSKRNQAGLQNATEQTKGNQCIKRVEFSNAVQTLAVAHVAEDGLNQTPPNPIPRHNPDQNDTPLACQQTGKPCYPPRMLRRRYLNWRGVSGLHNPATRLLRLSYTTNLPIPKERNGLRFTFPFSVNSSFSQGVLFNNNGWEARIWRIATAPPGWHVGTSTRRESKSRGFFSRTV
ncbi:unnamed protein product [Ectocarpus sp. 12 AP-2014]